MAAPDTGKSLHNFHCRDSLWQLFEQKSKKLDCSIDYLINEAMRFYAQSPNFLAEKGTQSPAAEQAARPSQPPPPPPKAVSPRKSSHPTRPLVPKPGKAQIQQAQPAGDSLPRPPAAQASVSTGQEPMAPQSSSTRSRLPRLTLIFQGRKIPVNKEQFIIGRGTKTTDLTIKDSNISRQHAGVMFHNNNFYIKDLGSTNGIEFQGTRIDSKRINEGDVFYLCDFEIHFTYES